MDEIINVLGGGGIATLLLAAFIILCVYKGVRIVSQSEKHVVERFGRLRTVLGPGINFIVPFLDRVAHQVSILERQLPTASQDAITADNVLVQVDTSVFYRITEPEKTVYRIRDVDAAIATTVAGLDPERAAKIMQASTPAMARPPRRWPTQAIENRMIRAATPPVDMKLDASTKNGMASSV